MSRKPGPFEEGALESDDARLRVLLVSPVEDGGKPWRWLRRAGDIDAQLCAWTDAGAARAACDVVWIDAPSLEIPLPLPAALATYPHAAVLLTRGACRLVAQMGLGPEPNEQVERAWRDADDDLHLFRSFTEFPHIRGHMPMRRHVLFDGLGNGSYTWWPAEGEAFARVTWTWPAWPANADVLAVERSYIHVNPERATIWRYTRADRAPVLCIGAYLPFESRELTFRRRLERLTRNALFFAAGRMSDGPQELVWRRAAPAIVKDPALPVPAAEHTSAQLPSFDGPSLAGTPDDDSPFTLAGRRVLVAGGEARGVDEVWMHPLRVLSSLRVAAASDRSSAGGARGLTRRREGAKDGCISVEVTPSGVVRMLRFGSVIVTERVFAAYDSPNAVFEWVSDAPVALDVSFSTDLRLMWPYPGWCLGPLRWRRAAGALVVHGSSGGDAATLAWNREPEAWEVHDASTDTNPVVASRVRIRVAPGSPARLTVTAVVDGEDARASEAGAGVRAGARHASSHAGGSAVHLVEERNAAMRALFAARLAVDCTDASVGEALRWAVYRLDSALVRTPGLGTSLVAGYWTSAEGWGDGRPGYAWYFGRDAVWTALGSLAAGDFDAAAHVLRFLGTHQDPSGKILHECTTSGAAHYDAADSTTLYLLLAVRYLAWTGDQKLIVEEWPRIRRAFDFLLTTDHDADGLVENTRQGHGWIEFGRLGGGDLTHYNAAIWTAALHELADAARVAAQPELATRNVALAIRARRALERTFYDEGSHRYALNVRRHTDGGWIGNWSQTAMQAVPLLLGMAEPARMERWLDQVAGDAFTAPWGVRMVPADDPHYDPKSYHGGAVWPLYTGWVSWAEYTAGRTRAAHRHWRMITALAFERAKGAWDEVLHGAEHRSAGVTPDQAWSTAMAVAPFVYGLLGVMPDAIRKRLRIAPQIPEEWDRLRVERIRVGDVRVSLEYEQEGGVHAFRLSASDPECRVLFEPAVPAPIVGVRVNGAAAALQPVAFGERHAVSLELTLNAPVTVEIAT